MDRAVKRTYFLTPAYTRLNLLIRRTFLETVTPTSLLNCERALCCRMDTTYLAGRTDQSLRLDRRNTDTHALAVFPPPPSSSLLNYLSCPHREAYHTSTRRDQHTRLATMRAALECVGVYSLFILGLALAAAVCRLSRVMIHTSHTTHTGGRASDYGPRVRVRQPLFWKR